VSKILNAELLTHCRELANKAYERVTAFCKDNVFGILALGVLASVIAGVILTYFTTNTNRIPSPLIQTGAVTIRASGTYEVHYPISYARPPYLTLKLDNDSTDSTTVMLTQQRADGFKFETNPYSTWSVTWRAAGQPAK